MSRAIGDPVLARVLEILGAIAGPMRRPAGAGADTPLAEDGFWLDSADLLEAVLACEEAFGVLLDYETDLGEGGLATAGRLAAAVRRKLAG